MIIQPANEGNDDSPKTILGGAAKAVAFPKKGREESGHDIEDWHTENVDQHQRPIERRGEFRRLERPSADR
jgi:hypothetical protein